MEKSTGCRGEARCAVWCAGAFLGAAFAAILAGPGAAVEVREDEMPFRVGTRPASSDCAFAPSHADPDGRRQREAVSRATRAFASAHPVASGSSFHPVARVSRVNYVDDEIFGKMEADHVPPAPRSSDTEFLRRVTLDLTGRIPDADVVVAFVADPSPDKRARMVDALLASDGFVDRWGLFMGDLFQSTAWSVNGRLSPLGRDPYHQYFRDSLRSGKPWDVMAKELITAAGVNQSYGPVNYVARQFQANGPVQDTWDNLTAFTVQTFLGMNAAFCTSCHNGQGHLDQINLYGSIVRRQDFWGMAAFFSRTSVTLTYAGTYPYTITDRATGAYDLNTKTGNKTDRTGAYYTTSPAGLTSITPSYLRTPANPAGGAPLPNEPYRDALARLVTGDPQFARAMVNRLWKELFKAGIVEPVDGFDLMRQDPASPPPGSWTIQPTHPALLTKLAQDFAAHGYDLRYILGVMAKSSAYQLSSFYPGTWSEAYTPYFARHFAQRMMAEQIFDAIMKATNVGVTLGGPGGTVVPLAMQLPDSTEPVVGKEARLLNPFLRGNRDGTPRLNAFSVPQALDMLNNDQITIRVKSCLLGCPGGISGSTVAQIVTANLTPAQAVDTLFLKTLSRYPTPAEKALCLSKAQGLSLDGFANNLQYVLLQKLDFLYNY